MNNTNPSDVSRYKFSVVFWVGFLVAMQFFQFVVILLLFNRLDTEIRVSRLEIKQDILQVVKTITH